MSLLPLVNVSFIRIPVMALPEMLRQERTAGLEHPAAIAERRLRAEAA
jgi:hypothetical protein